MGCATILLFADVCGRARDISLRTGGGPVTVNNVKAPLLGSAMITEEKVIDLAAEQDAELLLMEVKKQPTAAGISR